MSSTATHPQHSAFFTQLQHLLTDGEFVSTYKFALLLSLARWAVENPDHDETEPLDVGALAEHFLALYWPQVRPFQAPGPVPAQAAAEARPPYGAGDAAWGAILGQDRGGQRPRVLSLILAEHERGHDRVHALPPARRRALLKEVEKLIRTMPLWKLHVVGGDESFRFLYRRGADDRHLVFEPGIVACLAAFAPLVEHVVRAAWLQFVLRYNNRLLGSAAQVEQFLFPDGRNGLAAWRSVLAGIQGPRCFYCDGTMRQDLAVDHFLPWARYPRDLGHNFVLAHARCNQQKTDHLPSVEHLARWCRRNEEQGGLLATACDAARLPHDWPTLKRAAASLYRIAANANARVWQEGRTLVPLQERWRELLGAG